MESECKGCDTSYIDSDGNYKCMLRLVSNLLNVDHCPCRNCIIKGMCSRDCEKFETFIAQNSK